MTASFQLFRDPFGRLVLIAADGQRHEGVAPVQAFPISAPGRHVSIVAAGGQELAFVDDVQSLDPPRRTLVEEELARREFLPIITRIVDVSTPIEPSEWSVETDRGPTRFILNSDEDVRRLGPHQTIIVDSNSIRYLVRDSRTLDAASRRTLDRYL